MDEQIWFYIIAAVIYFLTRKKKKPTDSPSTPNTSRSDRPTQQNKPVSFEDLLREITEQREEESQTEPVYEERKPEPKREPEESAFETEGRNRQFSDDESRKVYEESIKQAEGADIEFVPDESYASQRLFKDKKEDLEPSIADEIRDSFKNPDTARKAIIYSEILQRKY